MIEVALAALRHHSSVWDIPFRAGTLLLSITISGILISLSIFFFLSFSFSFI